MTGYDVHIRRNADGLVRIYHHESEWHEASDFLWFEGNYASDGNRHSFFQWAANEPDDGGPDEPWGNQYTVLKFVLPDGTELEGDDDA